MKTFYKILIIVSAVLILGVAVYFAWWFFRAEVPFNAPDENTTAPSDTGPAPGVSRELAGVTLSTPLSISDHMVFDYWLVPETREVYYLTPEGYVYAVKPGPDLEISRQAIVALNRVEPSEDGRRLLASFGNPTAPQWAIFDTIDSIWRPLPREIMNAGWGRISSELVAMVASGSDTNLSFVDISKTPPTYTVIVRDFRMEDVMLSTLDGGDILVSERPSSRFNGNVWRVSPATRTIVSALHPAAGRVVKVERNENVSYIGSVDEFSLADGTFQNVRLFIFRTLPDKCTSAASTTYCFVPQNIPLKTLLPDDYLTHTFYSVDSLYSISQVSGAIAPILFAEGVFDASRVHANEKTVYFIDRYSSLLYKLEIE